MLAKQGETLSLSLSCNHDPRKHNKVMNFLLFRLTLFGVHSSVPINHHHHCCFFCLLLAKSSESGNGGLEVLFSESVFLSSSCFFGGKIFLYTKTIETVEKIVYLGNLVFLIENVLRQVSSTLQNSEF